MIGERRLWKRQEPIISVANCKQNTSWTADNPAFFAERHVSEYEFDAGVDDGGGGVGTASVCVVAWRSIASANADEDTFDDEI